MKKLITFSFLGLTILTGFYSCTKNADFRADLNEEVLSGGRQTAFDESGHAYSHMFQALSAQWAQVHEIGDRAFEQTFVSAPAPLNSGLGPIYNNVSCVSCHVGDGRGKVPGSGESAASILFRISQPGVNEHQGPLGIPGFGDQLQHRAIVNTLREADVTITYQEQAGQFADGSTYSLRKPSYTIVQPYTPLPSGVMLSPRVAAPMFGLGLLEALSEADILALADESDANQDGISGKANYVWNVKEQQHTLGKFGWKANQPSLLQQVAAAYNGDMGITTFLFPQESSHGQLQYDGLQDDVELSDSVLYSVEFYVKTLMVPARRNTTSPEVVKGKQLFLQAGCASCHIPDFTTAVNVAFPPISHQRIHPYTDLLLHDMGDDLGDGRPDFLAGGNEWRTPPLWGIGLTYKVNGHTNFLHDGRARNLMEAILWHGGEGAASRDKVKAMNPQERNALLAFLGSL